jgi:hypothetical protein
MHTHSFETNVAVTVVLLATVIMLILTNQLQAIIAPLGILSGWLVSEIVKRYLKGDK